jgi:hypothetical protein
MDNKLFEIASKVARPLSLASITLIALYLIYRAILGLNIFSPLEETNTFSLLRIVADRIFYLALFSLLLGVFSYLYVQRLKAKPQATVKASAITGNVYLNNGFPAKNATVIVDGIDRRKDTDSNGWFSLEVNQQATYTIRAYYDGMAITDTIAESEINKPVVLKFPKV